MKDLTIITTLLCCVFRTVRRFLVIDEAQFILVEPDTTRLGWGVVKFVALLQVSKHYENNKSNTFSALNSSLSLIVKTVLDS